MTSEDRLPPQYNLSQRGPWRAPEKRSLPSCITLGIHLAIQLVCREKLLKAQINANFGLTEGFADWPGFLKRAQLEA